MRQRLNIHITVLLFGLLTGVFANEPPALEKNIVRDSLDNIIISPDIPVYLHISNNPDGINSVKMNPENPEDSPLIFRNSGTHWLVHIDMYLQKEVRFYFMVDGEEPKSNWYSDIPYFVRNDTVYAGKGFSVYFAARDDYSGVNKIYHSVNYEGYKTFEDVLLLDSEGHYKVEFFAVDNVGNVEKPQAFDVVIDHSAPETQLTVVGDRHDNIVSPRSEINLESSDPTGVKNVFYSINDEPFREYTKKLSLQHLGEGYHTIKYYAEDLIGNIESEQSFRFFVDKTPPIIIEEITGNRFVADGREYSSGRSQLRITAVDNKAGVKAVYYSIDDKEYQKYERPVFLSGHSGEINIKTYAVDNVNNRSEGRLFHSDDASIPYVDLNAPDISHEITGPGLFLRDTLFIGSMSEIHLNANDRESGVNRIIYRVNQEKDRVYDEPFSVNKPGYHIISYTAYDNVENANNDNFTVFVDMEGPELYYNFSIPSYDTYQKNGESFLLYPSHVRLFLSAIDEKTGANEIFYSINEQPEQLYTKPVTGFEAGKVNNIYVRATDMLGNESLEEISFYVTDSH